MSARAWRRRLGPPNTLPKSGVRMGLARKDRFECKAGWLSRGTIRTDRRLSDWRGAEETSTVGETQTVKVSNLLQLNGLLYPAHATQKIEMCILMVFGTDRIAIAGEPLIAQSDVGVFAKEYNAHPVEIEADARMFLDREFGGRIGIANAFCNA
jgi:hypothetical protein